MKAIFGMLLFLFFLNNLTPALLHMMKSVNFLLYFITTWMCHIVELQFTIETC